MSLRDRYAVELRRVRNALRQLHLQTVVILLTAPLLVFIQFFAGSRRRFLEVAADRLPDSMEALAAWSWWFGMQGVTGFIIPVAILLLVFRQKPKAVGLSLGDWRFGLSISALYIPLVLLGTWVLSDSTAFQRSYPHLQQAAYDWQMLAVYELMFLFYWIGWEYLWRGYFLFGTVRTFGIYAIFLQAIPFALLHVNKPFAEALLSIVGGVALGAVVWRCRSFWYAVPVHALQMIAIDVWCTLRIRTGVSGKGWNALSEIFSRL